MAVSEVGHAEPQPVGGFGPSAMTTLLRIVTCANVAVMFGFLANVYLTYWRDWPGLARLVAQLGLFGREPPKDVLEGDDLTLAWIQALIYLLCLIGPIVYVYATKSRSLRYDAQILSDIAAFIIRASFWSVLFVGLADMVISFLRVEGYLQQFIGSELTQQLGRSRFRGPNVHLPLILLAILVAMFTRTLGFTWLALLVVVAELQIVVARFIFSYEQAFMGDLVRFWYAALFLFASAYTLIEEGHVRVDVLYAGFTSKTKGMINAIGSILLGTTLCWVILAMGMAGKSNLITSPILSLEVSQSGFGMYVKYLMAGFLAIFAISMMIQFASYLLESVADFRGDPGGREKASEATH